MELRNLSQKLFRKYQKFIFAALVFILSFALGYSFLMLFPWQKYWQEVKFKIQTRGIDQSCIQIKERQIKGKSLEPLIKEGTETRGLEGYYDCNPIKKGEITMLKFKTREETFVKKIVGLPEDEIAFQAENLKLNGQVLKNSAGEPYLFHERAKKLITIPLENGKIPEGRYLVLSEEAGPAAFDSRWYGFVEKEHLKGRVVYSH